MERPDGQAEASPGFHLWAVLWPSAVLFSLLSNADIALELLRSPVSPKSVVELALAGCALGALVRPWDGRLLVGVALLQLADVGVMMPFVFNHRLVLGLGSLALVLAAIAAVRRRGHEALADPEWIDAAVPAARVVTLIVYAFAFFAKLNRDFVDPDASCAVQFAGHITPLVRSAPALGALVTWGTLAIEGVLPLLLVPARTRRAAVMGGIAFHLVLSLDLIKHFLDFSAVMSSLLLLFLVPAATPGPVRGAHRALAYGFGALLLAELLAVALDLGVDARSYVAFVLVRQLFWLGFVAGILWLALRAVAPLPPARAALRVSGAPLAAVVLAALNGLAPYLGLKSHTGFNMYSNLEIRPDASNHWIVPRSLDPLGLDRVTVVAARPRAEERNALIRAQIRSDFDARQLEGLASLLEPGARFTTLELSRLLTRVPEIEVEVRTHDAIRTYDGRSPPPGFSWITLRLLMFRPETSDSASLCRW